ncbi:thioredoxin domain-containing protein [Rhodococcus xishaensis]|uniref:DsbA family protein n=1 Tax=Rhodococcus xishaensis TaxID=2487364 RepID=A0A3S3B851_9NOCA|nr:thioredoxin domain-containing protein [Rhodococcus xishaensis]RVW05340.1 DsbA family protein [Rhodococcus xishaensis]
MSSKKPKSAKYNPQPTSSKATYILGGLAIVVIAALVIGGVLATSSRNEPRNQGYGAVQNSAVQVMLEDDGIARLGLPDAANTIDVFEDPLCTYCAQLEETYGQEVAQAIDEGKLAVRYHMLDFLNSASASGDYSTRAGAAMQCVAESGQGIAYSNFHGELFSPDNQPAERGGSDLSNEDLANLARDAGASDNVVDCITSGERTQQAGVDAEAASTSLAAAGGRGTPTVVHDGQVIDAFADPEWVSQVTQ